MFANQEIESCWEGKHIDLLLSAQLVSALHSNFIWL